MSGKGTFAGTIYQARVTAYVYVHMLADRALFWVSESKDVPSAVSAETGGPGDDLRVETGPRSRAFEVQAKHGLRGYDKLKEAVSAMRAAAPDEPIVLAVDESSARAVTSDLRLDFRRLAEGRDDDLKDWTKRLLDDGLATSLLSRVVVVPLSVDVPADADAKHALHLLASDVLVDEASVAAVWDTLVADASDLASRRGRRTRDDLVALLKAKGVDLKPPRPDREATLVLDLIQKKLDAQDANHALVSLAQLEASSVSTDSAAVRQRIHRLRALACMLADHPAESVEQALLALEFDDTDAEALAIASRASLLGEVQEEAERYSLRAVGADPNSVSAWCARLIALHRGRKQLEPGPASVATDPRYMLTVANMKLEDGDLQGCLADTSAIIKNGKAGPRTRFLFAIARVLQLQAERVRSTDRRWTEAERAATRAAEEAELASNRRAEAEAIALRLSIRRIRGDKAGVLADAERARKLDPDNVEVRRQRAVTMLSSGDQLAALAELHHDCVKDQPLALAMRASLKHELGDEGGARSDFDAAVGLLGDGRGYEQAIPPIVATALVMDEMETAERLLSRVSGPNATPQSLALAGELAFRQGRDADATAMMMAAASADAEHAAHYIGSLVRWLYDRNKLADIVALLDDVDVRVLSGPAQQICVESLLAQEHYPRAGDILDSLVADGQPGPAWAIKRLAELAARQQDYDRALFLLQQLDPQDMSDHQTALNLAWLKLGPGNDKRGAEEIISRLLEQECLSAAVVMRAAALRNEIQAPTAQVIDIAYRALRLAPSDPEIAQGFFTLVATRPDKHVPDPSEVTSGSYVLLQREDGGETENWKLVVLDVEDARAEHKEITLAQARQLGLLGKTVGDEVVVQPGTFSEKKWRISEIRPAFVHAFQDIAENYETRYPTGTPFIVKHKLSPVPTIKDLAPLVSGLHGKRDVFDKVVALYKETLLPLGLLVQGIGGTVPELMAELAATEKASGGLITEWADESGREASRAIAAAATEIVITRSALHTLATLDALDFLEQYRVLAPASLFEEVRKDLAEASAAVEKGASHVSLGEDGRLNLIELPPDHDALVQRHITHERALRWLDAHAELMPRPLETLGPEDGVHQTLRKQLGDSSADAIFLAAGSRAAVVCDDVGLRRVPVDDRFPDAFSSFSLLETAAMGSDEAAKAARSHLVELLGGGYRFASPSVELLDHVLQHEFELDRTTVETVFGLLRNVDVARGAYIAAEVLKRHALAGIRSATFGVVVNRVLSALASKSQRNLVTAHLQRAAGHHLRLLPVQRAELERQCRAVER